MDIMLEVGQYIILPSTFNPKMNSKFQIRILHSESSAPHDALTPLRNINWISFKGSWKNSNAGGSVNDPIAWRKNDQYSFTIPRETKVQFILDQIQEPNKKLFGIGWVIFKSDEKVIDAEKVPLFSVDFRPNKHLTDIHLLSKGTYVIVPSTFEANQFTEFELKFQSPELLVSDNIKLQVL